jgi:hypothetical protein
LPGGSRRRFLADLHGVFDVKEHFRGSVSSVGLGAIVGNRDQGSLLLGRCCNDLGLLDISCHTEHERGDNGRENHRDCDHQDHTNDR